MNHLTSLITILLWIAGIVVSKGFWSAFFAITCPFWAFYLLIEQLLTHY